jgi:hypothetical protein
MVCPFLVPAGRWDVTGASRRVHMGSLLASRLSSGPVEGPLLVSFFNPGLIAHLGVASSCMVML